MRPLPSRLVPDGGHRQLRLLHGNGGRLGLGDGRGGHEGRGGHCTSGEHQGSQILTQGLFAHASHNINSDATENHVEKGTELPIFLKFEVSRHSVEVQLLNQMGNGLDTRQKLQQLNTR